jgi:hypothetical protein
MSTIQLLVKDVPKKLLVFIKELLDKTDYVLGRADLESILKLLASHKDLKSRHLHLLQVS